jgi:hypothetical protein
MRTRGTKHFAGLAFLCLIVSASHHLVFGQNPLDKSVQKSKPIAEKPIESSLPSTDANETFELNIDERSFTKTNFEASTAVDTGGGARGVNVRIGVSLTAGRIDVLLRNVRGNIRFRGTLDRILEVIGKGPNATPEVR